jgi:hypothetical protein
MFSLELQMPVVETMPVPHFFEPIHALRATEPA